jgi:hypothetical protein
MNRTRWWWPMHTSAANFGGAGSVRPLPVGVAGADGRRSCRPLSGCRLWRGGFLLSTAQAFPAIRGVGVEVVPAVAAEAERRARAVGVADRVEVRGIDARKLTDEDAFDAAFWAQPFFPASTRPGVLAAIHRALRPGPPS